MSDSTQNYTTDATYIPWLGYRNYILAGLLLGVLGVVAWRVWRSVARQMVAYQTVAPTSLDKPEYRDIETLRAERQRAEEDQFLRNLKDTLVLRSFELTGVRFFKDGAYEFRPRVNVLLGRNGYGKTLLLRTLAATIQNDLDNGGVLFPSPGKSPSAQPGEGSTRTVTLKTERNGEPEATIRDAVYFSKTSGKIPLLAIPDSRFVNRQTRVLTPSNVTPEELCRSGARHFITQEPYENKVVELLLSLCVDYLDHRKSFDQPVFRLIEQVVRELTDDDQFAFHSINRVGTTGFEVFVKTVGNEDEPLPIQYASQGTLSVLVIFGQVFYFLQSMRPKVTGDDVFKVPAIVLIDEIDAHLHPSWQQKIIGMLTSRFPNVQFIISGHSPLIVAGCDRKEVAVLRRPRATDRFEVEVVDQGFSGSYRRGRYTSGSSR